MASKSDKLTPLDMAINQTQSLLATLTRAKGSTSYPPAEQAHLWRAIDDHSRIKGFIDREQSSIAAAWARSGPQAGVTPLETAPRSCQEVPSGGTCDPKGRDADTQAARLPQGGTDLPSISRADLAAAVPTSTAIEAA